MNCFLKIAPVGIVWMLLTGSAFAETFEVKMLNRGASQTMVFEPDYLALAPGDTVKFLVGNRSHNAASIEAMVPDGFAGFKGKIDEEIEVTFDQPGTYGIKCSPHFGMGMVMLVKVGDGAIAVNIRTADVPARARKRFDSILEKIDAGSTQ